MQSDFQKTANPLSTPVQFLKGVGPERAKLLDRLELRSARDVLFFFPRDYHDLSEVRGLDQLVEGDTVSVIGTVEETDVRNSGLGKSVIGALIRQGNDYLRAVWFNQPHMQRRLTTAPTALGFVINSDKNFGAQFIAAFFFLKP